jgi:hypothetical protein
MVASLCEVDNKIDRVTKIKNIKTDSPKILRSTHFSGPKDIKTNKVVFDLIPGIFF